MSNYNYRRLQAQGRGTGASITPPAYRYLIDVIRIRPNAVPAARPHVQFFSDCVYVTGRFSKLDISETYAWLQQNCTAETFADNGVRVYHLRNPITIPHSAHVPNAHHA